MDNCTHKTTGCPINKWVDVFEKKWSIRIVRQLYGGAKGFNELKASVDGITQGMLSARLNELEKAGLVQRKVVNRKPLEVEYSLNSDAKCMLNCWVPEVTVKPQIATMRA